MKFDFKKIATPVMDIGLVAGGAVVGNQFLDFEKMFKTADPNGFFIKHQGGVKAVGSALAIGLLDKKLPSWAKMLLIGVGVGGAIKEIKNLSNGKIEAVGANPGTGSDGSDTSQLDRLLEEARITSMQGRIQGMGANDAGAAVGAADAGAGVGWSNNSAIPQMDYGSTVGWTM